MAFLITGPQGAGKTTVADVVARSFDRGVHVEGDAFRRFVVAGRSEMTEDASDEAVAQLRLRYALARRAAEEYEQAGCAHVFVLFPPEDVVAPRAGSRHAPWVYRLFAEATPRLGTWIDSGRLTPEETAAAILRR